MRNLLPILLFEWTYRKNRPAGYIYAGLLGLITFFMVASGSVSGPEQVDLFSGYMLAGIFSGFSLIMLFIASAIMSVAMYRDIQHHMTDTFFALPLRPGTYFWGRFLGAFSYLSVISLVLCLAIWLGAYLAPELGLAEKLNFGEVHPWPILTHWAAYMLPNLYIFAAIFFSLMALFRRAPVVFFGAFAVFILYTAADIFLDKLDQEHIGALLDPIGARAYGYETRFWTPEEMNDQSLFFQGYLIWNRLIWIGLATALLLYTRWRFRFAAFRAPASGPMADAISSGKLKQRPEWTYRPITGREYILNSIRLFGRQILREPIFYIMVLLALGFSLLILVMGNEIWETPGYPLTYNVLPALAGGSFLFLMILLVIYAGELVHRDRELRFHSLADSLPVQPAWNLLARWLTLVLITVLLVAVLFLFGVGWQLAHGFTDLNPGFYFWELADFLLALNASLMVCLTLHSLVKNKMLGHFLCVGFLVLPNVLGMIIKFRHHLLFPGSGPSFQLSDLAGFVPALAPSFLFNIYWLLFGALSLFLAWMLWPQGVGYTAAERWRRGLSRAKAPGARLLGSGLLLSFLGLGAFLFWNTNILNDFVTRKRGVADLAFYETSWKYLEDKAKPRFVHARLELDLHPDKRASDLRITGTVVNDDLLPIDTLAVLDEPGAFQLSWNGRTLAPVSISRTFFAQGQRMAMHFFVLPEPFAPGDSATLGYESRSGVKGIPHNDSDFRVLRNGSFLSFQLNGILGYSADLELEGEKDRKKHGLPPKDRRLPEPDAPEAGLRNIFGTYGRITLETIVSTDPDQTVIVPGYLQREWTEKGRRHFHYRMDEPMVDFFNICSGRYAVHEDRWTGPEGQHVAIRLFHHPGHAWNLESFAAGARDALDYYTRAFGPYPHKELRIIEFPRYSTFAQSFALTVPFSESFGWTADLRDTLHFDYPYYVTAHEVAHQWWGHQLVPANAQGGNLLSESLSEYSAIMVAERRFGRDRVGRFLRVNLNEYLEGRRMDRFPETPYIRSQDGYQDYKKGAMVFYAMRHYLGEEWVNGHIRQFLETHRDRDQGPYPTGTDLYRQMRPTCPDSLAYLMEDLWEHLCTYDLETREARAKPAGEDNWEVTLQIKADKQYQDADGKKTDPVHPMDDLVEVIVFGEPKGKRDRIEELPVLYRKVHRLQAGDTTLQVQVDRKPFKAGIDPYHILIDRRPENNVAVIRHDR